MKKTIVALALAISLAFILTSCGHKTKKIFTIPEQIMESVVIVNGSSGIIIHSDTEKTLVLTAYHIIKEEYEKAACSGCNYNVGVNFLKFYTINTLTIQYMEKHRANNIIVDEQNDLALVEIKSRPMFRHSKVSKQQAQLGDDIWIGANPNHVYRSLKRGIISSKERYIGNALGWEVSGGVIFGSSGGGIFNTKGQLIGIVKAVDMYETDYCYDVLDENGEFVGHNCITIPMTFIGFITPQSAINKFLLGGIYKKYFEYLQ